MLGGDVQVRISITGGDQAELESLDDWLRHEHGLAGRVTFAAAQPWEGDLGVLGEALIVAVGSGGAISVLAAALKSWLSLPRRSDVRIKVEERADRRIVEIEADRVSAERIDDWVRQVLSLETPPE
jgi:hypothetical protein